MAAPNSVRPTSVRPTSARPARGNVTIDVEECKGCGLCVESCPPKCLELAPDLSSYGVHPARYTGHDCTGCGICFYCCPEPGAIIVYRLIPPLKPHTPSAKAQVEPGEEHAPAL